MLNAPLKGITSTESFNGFKMDLTAQLSQIFQLGGMWHFNKTDSKFGLSAAVASDSVSQEANFVTGSYHNDGKLEGRSMFKLGYGLSLNTDISFPSSDIKKTFYAFEISKQFAECSTAFKYGTGIRSFTYMQAIYPNCFAGFECAYLVFPFFYMQTNMEDFFWNYGVKLGTTRHSVFFSYMPMAAVEPFSIGFMYEVRTLGTGSRTKGSAWRPSSRALRRRG